MKNQYGTISDNFSQMSKLWPLGPKMVKFSSFSRLVNIVSENLHYLGQHYSYRKSENGIRKKIKFPIDKVSSDMGHSM